MSGEKAALTATERQAKHRAEMLEKGFKSLSVGFVHERHHDAIKKLVAEINNGNFSDDLTSKTVVDTTETDKLKERIAALQGALYAAKNDLSVKTIMLKEQAETTGEQRERLQAFKKLFWRFYWRQ